MKDFFFQLPIDDLTLFLLKLFAFPIISLLIFQIVFTILMQIFKESKNKNFKNFIIKSRLLKMYSILFTLFVVNSYWVVLIWKNGIEAFNWLSFPFTLINLYVQLLPFILSIVLLSFIFLYEQKKIKTQL